MLQVKRNLLSAALASAVAITAMQAHAQEAAPSDDDEAVELDRVKVTGIRSAIEKSIDTKQSSTSIVEAISAEDIGKLPDSSIAESIARLPGLTAQRERGRASQINIRGFAGDFSATTLNGREQATTADNRGVEFEQYPSELLGSVVVYKTPDASLVGQGLSGTVDLRTVRPLDYDERVVAVGARYDRNKIRGQEETGFRYNLAYIDQFADGKLGLSIGFAHMDSPQPGYQNEPWGYTGFRGDPNLQILGGSKFFKFNADNKRDGLMATIQLRPNDTWESTLDWMHSRLERTEVKSGAEFWTEWGGGTTVRPGWVSDSNGTVIESTWDGVYPVVRMDSNPTESTLDAIGFNNKFSFGDNWTLNTDISFSRARNNYKNIETTAGIVGGTTSLHFALDPSGMFYNYEFGTDLSDPGNLVIRGVPDWGGQGGYYKDFNVEDKIHAFRVNLVRSFDSGLVRSIDFGVNHTDRSKFKTDYEARLCLVDCTGGMAEFTRFPGTVIDFGVGGIDRIAIYDADALVAAGTWNIFDSPLDWFWGKSWDVEEKVSTAYFQANIDTDLGNMPLRGNVGVQYQRAEQVGAGYIQASNGITTNLGDVVSYGDKYGNVLPSMNLGLEFLPEFQLRFAAARQIMRPPMENMRGGMSVGICNTCASEPIWSGSGGNGALRPWLANAYDLSLEKYFSTAAGNRGYVGLAYFYKDLVSYVWNQTVPFDFAGFPLPPAEAGQTNYPTSTLGQISQPANGKNGSIKGLEATLSLPFDLLWSPLNGFGIVASYSDTSSSIRMNPDDPNSYPLPGLSKYVSNVSVYYERFGFALRYNRRQRSDFVGGIRNYEGVVNPERINGEVVQDAQVSYSFNKGALEGLSLYLQVSNIGDEPFTRSLPQGPTTYWEYGRTTLLGFSYKF
ncbi:MAG: TonB-dependent receptor [Luteimonas sp.]|nr:TonB-dependent receptor [Luteimonas sp.]